ncbi:hypothetical protein GCM10022243_15930 [Saccharothrix violaceirubra]|uniref:ArsR family transcriptional regulator n=1 Tax=Saccharothrix violaceirubra TaxID=413306 RepID=A0A7W7T8Y0_9PSEU|nr:metalloregulator ArsR/SmtB family transcription factor [Saccharothrix violaceirubra]MBB4967470.1 ArsR family transcriptional regulator [Saccharothrix violaceirubra]
MGAEAAISVRHAEELAKTLKALAHPIRLRLVSLLAHEPDGEACVCAISAEFGVTGPTISHHLRLLREAGVLACERRGTWVYYRLNPDVLDPVLQAIPLTSTSPSIIVD